MRSLTAASAFLLLLPALAAAEGPEVAWTAEGLNGPESVAWDPGTGFIYVADMGADPMAKDGDGAIARLRPDGTLDRLDWATGLDAPKGIDTAGGRLYAADIDQLVEIDLASGAVTNRYPAEGAVLLNGLDATEDGRVFVTDTMTGAIWLLEDGRFALWAQDPGLAGANGVLHDGGRLIVANVGDLSQGFENIKPGWTVAVDAASRGVTAYGDGAPMGVLDGLVADGKGGVFTTDYMAGTVLHQIAGAAPTTVATLGLGAADLDIAPELGLLIVPVTPENKVVALRY